MNDEISGTREMQVLATQYIGRLSKVVQDQMSWLIPINWIMETP